jgi:hypothetical protein
MLKKTLPIVVALAVQPVLAVDAEKAFSQGKNYYKQNHFTQAAPLLDKAAVQGHTGAQGLLGSMYLIGRGLPKDATRAIHWLTKAGNKGHAEAQSLLGAIYLIGKDAPQDLVKARRWVRKSARQGLADAQYLLGAMYFQGKGVPQHMERAHHWLSLAAAQGHQKAIAIRDLLPPAPPTAKRLSAKKPSPPSYDGKYRLTVNAIPAESRIRIMNIKPKYRPGIALKPGKYDIYVTRPGHISKRMWVELKNADLSIDIVLEKK